MINEEAVNRAREEIRDKIGSLDDLPRELANTIANVYYKDALVFFDLRDYGSSSLISKSINKHINDFLDTLYMVPVIPEHIRNLRELRTASPSLYDYAVEFFLDVYKYQIKNAIKKSQLRRRIERIFYKPAEIPNLIGLIDDD